MARRRLSPTARKRLEWAAIMTVGLPFGAVLGDKHAYRWPNQGPWEKTRRGPAKSWRDA